MSKWIIIVIMFAVVALHGKEKEGDYNDRQAERMGGEREVRKYYKCPGFPAVTKDCPYIIVDIVTKEYAIEGGLDKRSSLDSVQQAVFAADLLDKKPMVIIYDTDGVKGNYEHRIMTVCRKLGIDFRWIERAKKK